MTTIRIGRRAALAAGVAALASPAVVRAQADPIKLATLTPLTGAGGPYGPVMAKAAASVVEEVNKAGGVLGRRIVLVSEDDQTNPEAAVRATRKLIDVDKVSAIMNLLDGKGHYKESDPAKIEPFTALMIGPFLDAIAADPDIAKK